MEQPEIPAAVVAAVYRAWEKCDLGTISELIDDNAKFQSGGQESRGKSHILAVAKWRCVAFSDLRFDLKVIDETGDEVLAEVTWTGRHTGPLKVRIPGFEPLEATGKTVRMGPARITYVVRAGKIVGAMRPEKISGLERQLLAQLGMVLDTPPPF